MTAWAEAAAAEASSRSASVPGGSGWSVALTPRVSRSRSTGSSRSISPTAVRGAATTSRSNRSNRSTKPRTVAGSNSAVA
ncbi:Uncharacterised protein [Mycobacteroides abscessus subsp. abscessus]|nr:Uncharacterised protein [Mycobacteroides abscessus subsp. abscessus]